MKTPNDKPVILSLYSNDWPVIYKNEAEKIRGTLNNKFPGLEHVGSTSVPGLMAKPIIDIILGLESLTGDTSFIVQLEKIGYDYIPEYEEFIPDRRYFNRTDKKNIHYHLHACEFKGGFWIRHIRFRDILRKNKTVRNEYESLKIKLAEIFRYDRREYTEGKTRFIQDTLRNYDS